MSVNKLAGYGVCALALLSALPVRAQQSDDNVVRNATDAFGLRVGTESIGLYDAGNVRGFSPDSAGNVRVAGLFISQQGELSDRVVDATSIRVGLNTVGLLFPAPSGIADLSLRNPDRTGVEMRLGLDPQTSPFMELDSAYVATDGRFKLSAGVSARPDQNGAFGGDYRAWSAGFVPRWQLAEKVSITAYADWDQQHDIEVVPNYLPDGPYLPPRVNRDVDHTLAWGDWAYESENQGVILDAGLMPGLTARAGLFRSIHRLPYDTFALLSVTPDRQGRMVHVLLPATRYAALSGEASVAYDWVTGHMQHTISLAGRGLSKRSRKGGDVEVDYGSWSMDRRPIVSEPVIMFDQPQDRNRVKQYNLGLAYNLSWDGRLDLGAGLQKADYTKIALPGTGGEARGGSAPWLYNAVAAWRFDNDVIVYASYSKGLEESGSAPITAVNRNAVLPAVKTTQREAGLRTPVGPLTLTSSVFDVRRPYDGIDAAGRYGFLGEVRHRGLEASLSGEPVEGLSLVLGAVLLDPEVRGEEVRQGLIGSRPVGQSRLQWQASVDYTPGIVPGLSVDMTVDHSTKTTARGDNLADAPAYTLVDAGLRQEFGLWGQDASLRAQVQNLFDAQGFFVEGDGEYEPMVGRTWRLSLTVRM